MHQKKNMTLHCMMYSLMHQKKNMTLHCKVHSCSVLMHTCLLDMW